MDYPIWDLASTVGGGVLIGVVAILHVVVSHFAVGGGIVLAVIETLSVRRGDPSLRELANRGSKILILVSTVFGAISGVGIWFTIGLVQPAATSALIHLFVWAWAIEWAFFLLEVVTALAYFATWDRVSKRTHLLLIWLYAFAAYMSLVVIQGILAFMLTPGRWLETHDVLDAFFNPTYLPGIVYRTGVCLLLAGAYLAFAALREKGETRFRLVRLLALFETAGALVAYAGYRLWEGALPAEVQGSFLGVKATLPSLASTRHLVLWALAAFLLLAITTLLLPRLRVLPVSILVFALAFLSFGAFERLREGARKPFVVRGYMFSNGVLVSEVPALNRAGILSKARWAARQPGAGGGAEGLGRAVFLAECSSCHTLDGYLSIRSRTDALDADMLSSVLDEMKKDGDAWAPFPPGKERPKPGYPVMAPFVGTDADRDALVAYLVSLKRPAAGKEAPSAR
jgi:cytochrome bd ubiquinol oxidase subunit I